MLGAITLVFLLLNFTLKFCLKIPQQEVSPSYFSCVPHFHMVIIAPFVALVLVIFTCARMQIKKTRLEGYDDFHHISLEATSAFHALTSPTSEEDLYTNKHIVNRVVHWLERGIEVISHQNRCVN